MARQSPNRPDADEPAVEPEAQLGAAEAVEADATVSAPKASSSGGSVWADARITPVEIALPGGVGFTLRAYRPASELTPTEVDLTGDEDPFDARERLAGERRASEDDEEVVILDEEFAALVAEDEAE